MHDVDDDSALRRELDHCVKCGLCLPECPTYRLYADEGESPRGRLALFEGLLHGRLDADAALAQHIDNCLNCHRCERICPSGVHVVHLIDAARTQFPANGRRYVARLLQRVWPVRVTAALNRAMPEQMSRAVPTLHAMHRAVRALPDGRKPPAAGVYAHTHGTYHGRVGLFVGCTGAALQAPVLHAAIRLLQRIGFDVEVARRQTCCGALAAHAGDVASADTAARRVRATFGAGLDGVVSIASGCGIHLDTYTPPLPGGHHDIGRFLLERGALDSTDFDDANVRVAVHTPCSVENVYRGGDWAVALLRLLPGIELVAVGEPGQCCGAAGDHMLRKPTQADRLRKPLLDELAGNDTDVLVTANVGCALHLLAGLRGQGRTIEVLHPVELLARYLR